MEYSIPKGNAAMSKRWLYFGGTFDPVHEGHLRIARALAEAIGASRVLLVPTGVNPIKPPPAASAEDRLAMLRRAVGDESLLEICDLEIRRPPPCYTIDTVEALQTHLGPETELHLAVGADMLADLPRWRRAVDLLRQVPLVVACRPPLTLPRVEQALKTLADTMMKSFGLETFRAQAIPTPLLEISSRDIRHRISKGLSVEGLVPKEVMEYIRENELYNYPMHHP